MAIKVKNRELEAEREIAYRYIQLLSRAEALVPGAGRDAIEALLWDAGAAVSRMDVQNERLVLEGTVNCQAVYRQGEESTLRALSAKSSISQAIEIPGAQPGMLCRSQARVENVDAKYENGHMVFLVSIGICLWVSRLESLEVIEEIEEPEGIEARYRELSLVKLAAEASETAVLTERVELPASLDARASLMDWGSVLVESTEQDLGGVRVKGHVTAETLVASGIEGRPAVSVKYPIEFEKLIELPEWLCKDACVLPSVRSVRTQLEHSEESGDCQLVIQADVRFDVASNIRECVQALEDVYSSGCFRLKTERMHSDPVTNVKCGSSMEMVRGTVLLDEGSSVASVIAVRALPNIAETEKGKDRSRISGLLDACVLYMPNGSDQPRTARTSLPFSAEVPFLLENDSAISISIASAEANALMSDRLEMKIGLSIFCETRCSEHIELIRTLEAGESYCRRPAYVICWPEAGEDAWAIGKRYDIPEAQVLENAGEGGVQAGKALVLRI